MASPGNHRESYATACGVLVGEVTEPFLNGDRECAMTIPKPGVELASLLSWYVLRAITSSISCSET